MVQGTVNKNKVAVLKEHPVDNAMFLYSADMGASLGGAEVQLKEFNSKELANERIKPVEFISITVPFGEEEKAVNFSSFKDANAFLRDMAGVAPSVQDGADRFLLYVEWENKHEAAFKGFTAYQGYLYATKEMEQESKIVERSVAVRYLYDAGLLRPNGVTDEKWADIQMMKGRHKDDKSYLISALRHCEGLNGVVRDLTQIYERQVAVQNKGVRRPIGSLRPKAQNNVKANINSNEGVGISHG